MYVIFEVGVIMSGRKRKKPNSYVPDSFLETEDGERVDHLRDVPPVPLHYLRRGHLPHVPQSRVPQPSQDVRAEIDDQDYLPQPSPDVRAENEVEIEIDDQDCVPQPSPDVRAENEVEIEIDDQDCPPQPSPDAAENDTVDEIQGQHEFPVLSPDIVTENEFEIGEEIDIDDEDEDEDEEEDKDEDENEDEDEGEDEENVDPLLFETYTNIYAKLSEDWMLAEVDHKVSKRASELFWKIGRKYFHSLYVAKERESRRKKVPNFKQARKSLYKENVPEITVEVAYKHKRTGEITVEKGNTTPTSKYPANLFSKMSEIASVEVNKVFVCVCSKLFFRLFLRAFFPSVFFSAR